MTDVSTGPLPRVEDPAAAPGCDEAFLHHLELLFDWKRKHMPILDMPKGGEVLVWLLKGGARPRPLKDLYRSSRFSEPTVRGVLKALVDDGYILIDRNPEDLRVRTVHLTPKLLAKVQEYLELLRKCAQPSASAPAPPGTTAVSSPSAGTRPQGLPHYS